MKFQRTIVSLAFAVLVLLSSTSFLVGVHYCQGEVESVALFSKADCGMAMELPPCHRHMANRCCEDEIVMHDGQDFNKTTAELNFITPFISEVSAPALLLAELFTSDDFTAHVDYDPPLRTIDRMVTLQVFII